MKNILIMNQIAVAYPDVIARMKPWTPHIFCKHFEQLKEGYMYDVVHSTEGLRIYLRWDKGCKTRTNREVYEIIFDLIDKDYAAYVSLRNVLIELGV